MFILRGPRHSFTVCKPPIYPPCRSPNLLGRASLLSSCPQNSPPPPSPRSLCESPAIVSGTMSCWTQQLRSFASRPYEQVVIDLDDSDVEAQKGRHDFAARSERSDSLQPRPDPSDPDERSLQAVPSPLRKRPHSEAWRPAKRLAMAGESDYQLALRLQKEEEEQAMGPSLRQTQQAKQVFQLGTAGVASVSGSSTSSSSWSQPHPLSLQQRLTARNYAGATLPSLLSSSSQPPLSVSDAAVSVAPSSSSPSLLPTGNVQLPLRVQCFGTAREPVILIRNVDGQRGKTFADMVQSELHRLGRPLPVPSRRGARAAIAVDWHRSKRSATPWKTGVRVLIDAATALQKQLSKDFAKKYPCLAVRRPWNDTEVLVTTPGCKLGKHRDAQPAGSLLFIFCCGLSCQSLSWPGGELVESVLESGDVMIIDGKRTAHAVPAVLEDTSPMPCCPWLGKRRMAVLVRQSPHLQPKKNGVDT